MPTNKHAAFRYRTIDRCFSNPGRPRWTLLELQEIVTEKLAEAFGGQAKVSTRTLQADFQTMRSDPPLGYAAPIGVDRGYYFYTVPGFSIAQAPFSHAEKDILREALALWRQIPGLPQPPVLAQLLDRVGPRDNLSATVIQFETNPLTQGLHWLAPLYSAITAAEPLLVDYQPFQTPVPQSLVFHPYLLKEWRNRWYLIGRHHELQQVWNLALDRIQNLHKASVGFQPNDLFDPLTHFEPIIGVTLPARPRQEIRFRVRKGVSGYLLTKPLHSTQQLCQAGPEFDEFSLFIIPNLEARGELLRFGPDLELITPVEW